MGGSLGVCLFTREAWCQTLSPLPHNQTINRYKIFQGDAGVGRGAGVAPPSLPRLAIEGVIEANAEGAAEGAVEGAVEGAI